MSALKDDRDMLTAARAVVHFTHGCTLADYEADLLLRSAIERQIEIVVTFGLVSHDCGLQSSIDASYADVEHGSACSIESVCTSSCRVMQRWCIGITSNPV
jgi:hypothetical protein